jgi:SRSO17 transposase
VRRQTEPGPGKKYRELAFYRCAAPARTPLREMTRVAGARWAIEECFQTAKNEAGLGHYQVRDYRAWYAHITLPMLAAAYLAATRARTDPDEKGTSSRRNRPDPAVGQRDPPPARRPRIHPNTYVETVIRWSTWRRRRQHQASHYRRRGQQPP